MGLTLSLPKFQVLKTKKRNSHAKAELIDISQQSDRGQANAYPTVVFGDV